MLNTLEINKITLNLIKDFDGTFPINNLPITRKKNYKLIINIDTKNLPGKHWIAVYVCGKIGYVFDPLGNPPPLILQHWLNKQGIRWMCNLRQVQPNDSILCGYYCIYFLFYVKDTRVEHLESLLNKLFPNDMNINQHDSIVQNFSNLFIVK